MKLITRILLIAAIVETVFIGLMFVNQATLSANLLINSLSVSLMISLLYSGYYEILNKGRRFENGRISGFLIGIVLGACLNLVIYLTNPQLIGFEALLRFRGILYPLSIILGIIIGVRVPLAPKVDSMIYQRIKTVRESYNMDS